MDSIFFYQDIEQQAGPKKKALLTKENQAFYIQRGGEKVKTDYKGILAMMNEYELQLSLEEIIIFRQVANSQLLNREAVNQFISSLLEVWSYICYPNIDRIRSQNLHYSILTPILNN